MNFLAYLVISMTQLTPLGPAITNVALPFPTLEACEFYRQSAESEVLSASQLNLINSSIECVDSKALHGEPEEPKADPKKQI